MDYKKKYLKYKNKYLEAKKFLKGGAHGYLPVGKAALQGRPLGRFLGYPKRADEEGRCEVRQREWAAQAFRLEEQNARAGCEYVEDENEEKYTIELTEANTFDKVSLRLSPDQPINHCVVCAAFNRDPCPPHRVEIYFGENLLMPFEESPERDGDPPQLQLPTCENYGIEDGARLAVKITPKATLKEVIEQIITRNPLPPTASKRSYNKRRQLMRHVEENVDEHDASRMDGDLNMEDMNIVFLPESIGDLTVGGDLNLRSNALTTLPESFGNLTVNRLLLSNNQLEVLPESIGDLIAFEMIDLSANKLTALPYSFGRIHTQIVYIYNNRGDWPGADRPEYDVLQVEWAPPPPPPPDPDMDLVRVPANQGGVEYNPEFGTWGEEEDEGDEGDEGEGGLLRR